MSIPNDFTVDRVSENYGPARFKPFRITYDFHESDLGDILIAKTAKGICWISFVTNLSKSMNDFRTNFPKAMMSKGEVALPDVDQPVDLDLYGTPFQISVWKELLKIPKGETVTYQDVAKAVGRPRAMRAVGTAVGSNPVSLVVPCHRVMRTDGGIGGYAWGIDLKRRILLSESA